MTTNAFHRSIAIFHRTVVLIAMTFFIGMLLATAAQVVFRYVLEISVDWTEELARVLFILSMFLGIAIAVKEKQHIVIDFLFNRLSKRMQGALGIVYNLVILALLVSLMKGAASMVVLTWESYMIAITWMRTGYLYLGESFAIGLTMLYIVLELIERVNAFRADHRERGDGST